MRKYVLRGCPHKVRYLMAWPAEDPATGLIWHEWKQERGRIRESRIYKATRFRRQTSSTLADRQKLYTAPLTLEGSSYTDIVTLQGYVMSIMVLIIRRSSFLLRSESLPGKEWELSYPNRADSEVMGHSTLEGLGLCRH